MGQDDRQSASEILASKGLYNKDEANLLWDEYKYRHDLIWRHLIRSTLALVALVTVRYVKEFKNFPLLALYAFLAALIYWFITYYAIDKELHLFLQIKAWHRYRQYGRLGMHIHDQSAHSRPDFSNMDQNVGKIYRVKGFPCRVGRYLALLFIGILLMFPLCDLVKLINSLNIPLSIPFC